MEGKAWFSVRVKVSCIFSLLSKTVKQTQIKCHIVKSLPCILKPLKKNRCALITDISLGFPSGSVVKTRLQCRRPRRCRFSPWVGKIPWKRKWQPLPVFLSGKSHWQRSLAAIVPGAAASRTWLSNWAHIRRDYTSTTISPSNPTSQKPLQSYL